MAVNHDNLGERITKLNETKEVEKRQNTASNVSNVSNEVKIVVDSRKLNHGLRTTFEGVAMIFDSLDTDPEAIIAPIKAVETLKAAEATSTETAETENASENSTASAMPEASTEAADLTETIASTATASPASQSEKAEEPETAEVKSETRSETPIEQTKPEEQKSSITFDDITKVIVKKIQQNNANSERIKELVNSFGVAAISQLAKEKYEAFMTELASL